MITKKYEILMVGRGGKKGGNYLLEGELKIDEEKIITDNGVDFKQILENSIVEITEVYEQEEG